MERGAKHSSSPQSRSTKAGGEEISTPSFANVNGQQQSLLLNVHSLSDTSHRRQGPSNSR